MFYYSSDELFVIGVLVYYIKLLAAVSQVVWLWIHSRSLLCCEVTGTSDFKADSSLYYIITESAAATVIGHYLQIVVVVIVFSLLLIEI